MAKENSESIEPVKKRRGNDSFIVEAEIVTAKDGRIRQKHPVSDQIVDNPNVKR